MTTEKRLIDANAMREDWLENGENEYVYDTNAVLASIDAQPTVDAVEVVHGTWLDWHGNPVLPDEFYRWWRCSECKYQYVFDEAVKKEHFPSNYCPNCGAKMDGDGNG